MSSDKPRAVLLANAGHKPLDTRIFHKEAQSLYRAGYLVTIIVPHSESFTLDGISIDAVPLPTRGWQQLVVCPWQILRRALKHPRRSIFHLQDSELLLAGIVLKFTGRTVVYDAHEDTPLQISYQHWIPRLIKGPYSLFYRILEKLAGLWFDAIIVAEPVIAKYFPSRKVTLVRNFPIAASFSEVRQFSRRRNQMVYVGLLSKPRGVVEMLEAHRIAAATSRVEFILGGKFAPTALQEELLSKYKADYRSWLPYETMVETLYESRIGIIVPNPIERYKTNYPVKLFEYMAAGLPVIASTEGESATFVNEAEAGILVNPLDVPAIAQAIVILSGDTVKAEEMGKRGRALILDKYNWENESRKLLHLYQSLS